MTSLRDAAQQALEALDAGIAISAKSVLHDRLRAALAQEEQEPARAPTVEAAYQMGAKGGLASDAERLAFEAWMRGHCWALCARWSGTQYLSDYEQGGAIDPHAMRTRQLWAAWRDRAALVSFTKSDYIKKQHPKRYKAAVAAIAKAEEQK